MVKSRKEIQFRSCYGKNEVFNSSKHGEYVNSDNVAAVIIDDKGEPIVQEYLVLVGLGIEETNIKLKLHRYSRKIKKI